MNEWKKEYVDPDVLDGTQWSLDINMTDKRVRHYYGSNDYPPYWTELKKIFREEDGIDAYAPEKVTLNQLWDKYFSQKYDLKPTTRANYKYCYDRYVRDGFGRRKIADIKGDADIILDLILKESGG